MEYEDAVMLKTKKKKLAINSNEESEGKPNFITTKTQEERADRENFEHKVSGDKPKEVKKHPKNKEDTKPKTYNRSISPSKPKPRRDKDKQKIKRSTDQKLVVKRMLIPSYERNSLKKKKIEYSEESESDESEDENPRKKVPSLKPKSKRDISPEPEVKILIYDVLKRWWYCVPDWPPAGFDYIPELAKQKLRKVDQKYWRIEPETDVNGFKKVFEMPSYPGVFKNSKGELFDLRPKDSCPSYEVFKKKRLLELYELKTKALRGQIEDLEKSVVVDEDLLKQLNKELVEAGKLYERQKKKT